MWWILRFKDVKLASMKFPRNISFLFANFSKFTKLYLYLNMSDLHEWILWLLLYYNYFLVVAKLYVAWFQHL